jgi:uncharacterized repeat protein (TIGR01451 family)
MSKRDIIACLIAARGAVRRSRNAVACIALTAVADGVLAADAAAPVALATSVEKVVTTHAPDGSTRTALVAGADLLSGDEVVYSVVFTNTSPSALDHLRVTTPIPAELRYVKGSAAAPGGRALYSVDGGETFGAPPELLVVDETGTRRAAEESDYTHLRWVIEAPLATGARGFARFRAIVR